MKLYADARTWRTRQVAADVVLVAWVALWVWVGMHVHDLIAALTEPGRAVESAGQRFAGTLEDVSGKAGDIPLVGGALEEPFRSAAAAGRVLEGAGREQQELVMALALWLGLSIAVIPIALALLRHVPGRIRWIREATAADRLKVDAPDLQLFALRAIATRPLYELQAVTPDPAAAFARGDYADLARLELDALGLEAPDRSA